MRNFYRFCRRTYIFKPVAAYYYGYGLVFLYKALRYKFLKPRISSGAAWFCKYTCLQDKNVIHYIESNELSQRYVSNLVYVPQK